MFVLVLSQYYYISLLQNFHNDVPENTNTYFTRRELFQFLRHHQHYTTHFLLAPVSRIEPYRQLICFQDFYSVKMLKKTSLKNTTDITELTHVSIQCYIWYTNINAFPILVIPESLLGQSSTYPFDQKRLTSVQIKLFSLNLFSLQFLESSSKYMLLQPRSLSKYTTQNLSYVIFLCTSYLPTQWQLKNTVVVLTIRFSAIHFRGKQMSTGKLLHTP